MRNDLDLAIADLGDLDDIAEVADAAVDLDLVLQKLLEGGDVEDLVGGGLRGVDDELFPHQHNARSLHRPFPSPLRLNLRAEVRLGEKGENVPSE